MKESNERTQSKAVSRGTQLLVLCVLCFLCGTRHGNAGCVEACDGHRTKGAEGSCPCFPHHWLWRLVLWPCSFQRYGIRRWGRATSPQPTMQLLVNSTSAGSNGEASLPWGLSVMSKCRWFREEHVLPREIKGITFSYVQKEVLEARSVLEACLQKEPFHWSIHSSVHACI